jgi:phosphoserine phosphatase RsbU/P
MNDSSDTKIRDLEDQLENKQQEILRYKNEIQRMNSTLESLISQLSQELKWVGLIQKALSPVQLPNIPGFEFSSKFVPGNKSGGDYFDIFEHEDRLKFGILVSASSGYSMSALFLSVLMKLSSKIESKKGSTPSQAIELLRAEMQPNLKDADRADLLYGFVDRRSFEFKFCSIGQFHAYHQIHGQDKIVRLESCGEGLSNQQQTKLLDNSIQLNSKDRLIFATSGVGLSPEAFKNTILRAPRSGVHELRNEILIQAEKLSPEFARDATVIVVEVNDRVIKLAN